jgi:hypothetical protein
MASHAGMKNKDQKTAAAAPLKKPILVLFERKSRCSRSARFRAIPLALNVDHTPIDGNGFPTDRKSA